VTCVRTVSGLLLCRNFGLRSIRAYEGQLNRATALSLLINAIVVWNTRYYDAVGAHLGGFTDAIWSHISPISWEHILFVGNYSFDDLVLAGALRPLLVNNEVEP